MQVKNIKYIETVFLFNHLREPLYYKISYYPKLKLSYGRSQFQ